MKTSLIERNSPNSWTNRVTMAEETKINAINHHHLIDISPELGGATAIDGPKEMKELGIVDGAVEMKELGVAAAVHGAGEMKELGGTASIDGAADKKELGGAVAGAGGAAETKWLRKLTSSSVNTAVLRDLIARTPMLWYLGERSGTILRPRSRRAGVDALHAVRAVAIGPFHRRDHWLPFPDDAKLPFLRYLQDQCGLDVEHYVAALADESDRLRDEFADDDVGDDVAAEILGDEEKFLQMVLLDSCFILVVSMMLSKVCTDGDKASCVSRAASISREYFILHMAVSQHAEDIKLDMLVLENQVPFAAVKLLAASCSKLKLLRPVEELVLGCFDDILPKRASPAAGDTEPFQHVLHLFHWSRVPTSKYCILSTPRKLLKIKKESERLFPSSMELCRSAVWFRSAAASCGDLDMWFWGRTASPVAVMTIPCLDVHEYSATVLHNMIAFEKHFHWAHGACVTAHVARMEGLVRCPQDAAFLRRRGVLSSMRKTDAELVAFFRELGEETVGARLPDEYAEMVDAVACHRSRKVSWWCGGFVLHFFPSPWVVVSLVAAAAVIVVPSLLQTVYTILSYVKTT
ncbi:UPF0481 protein At3g47200 [Oryza sativa Japonica Group]|jgi:hypothetical protein|nr:uncharacterized protein LOC4346531 [Oryza sativa Japonica Group]KAF2915323.1 hypothetical protein DAI22_09g022700 [Oryza sativa Japonica Group]